jgi:hypothetical protein
MSARAIGQMPRRQALGGRKAQKTTTPRRRLPRQAQPETLIGKEYLDLADLTRYSGLSLRTLHRHLTGPTPLPAYRIGGKLLVRCSEFDTWAMQFRVKPVGSSGVDPLVDDIMRGL